jgi:hypothetical protein
MKHILKTLIFAFVFTSCGTMRFNKTSDFAKIKDVKDLEGYYLNFGDGDGKSILSCFNVREYADFVTIASDNPKEIKLIYFNGSTKQEQVFKGRMKKKFFEIYFSKLQIIIPPILSIIDIDRIRIGKTKDGKLLIRNLIDQNGNLLVITGPYSVEDAYIFSYADEHKSYTPIQDNGLWGYIDTSGHIVIPAKYDFATIFKNGIAAVKLNDKWGFINTQGKEFIPVKYDSLSLHGFETMFEHGIAYVKLNDKWGLINTQGEEITPIRYDNISLSFMDNYLQSPPIFRVSIGEKTGILDVNGNEIIPVIYDYIGSSLSTNELTTIRLDDKWGFANRSGVVIPAIYSTKSYSVFGKYIQVQRDGKYYIIDNEGYEYEAKGDGFWKMRDPNLNTKKKIQLE